jgi:hypothetical protein
MGISHPCTFIIKFEFPFFVTIKFSVRIFTFPIPSKLLPTRFVGCFRKNLVAVFVWFFDLRSCCLFEVTTNPNFIYKFKETERI